MHALHPYPARFIPQIPRKAILEWTKKGDTVLDPFCGCGTTLLESSLLERPSIGINSKSIPTMLLFEANPIQGRVEVTGRDVGRSTTSLSVDLNHSTGTFQALRKWNTSGKEGSG